VVPPAPAQKAPALPQAPPPPKPPATFQPYIAQREQIYFPKSSQVDENRYRKVEQRARLFLYLVQGRHEIYDKANAPPGAVHMNPQIEYYLYEKKYQQ
jgi:hypothetical protein